MRDLPSVIVKTNGSCAALILTLSHLVSSLHLQERTPSLAVAHLSPLCASLQEISWLHGCPWPSAAWHVLWNTW